MTVAAIGDWAFCDQNELTAVTLPDTIISIGKGAFSHCESLKSLTLADGLRKIEACAFERCNSLRMLTMPASVESIADDAFSYSNKLKLEVTAGSYAEQYAKEHGLLQEKAGAAGLDAQLKTQTEQNTNSTNAAAELSNRNSNRANVEYYVLGYGGTAQSAEYIVRDLENWQECSTEEAYRIATEEGKLIQAQVVIRIDGVFVPINYVTLLVRREMKWMGEELKMGSNGFASEPFWTRPGQYYVYLEFKDGTTLVSGAVDMQSTGSYLIEKNTGDQ